MHFQTHTSETLLPSKCQAEAASRFTWHRSRPSLKTIAQTFIALSVSAMLPTAHAEVPMELCKVLRNFVESIPPNSEQEFT